jgi:hypothetical protein
MMTRPRLDPRLCALADNRTVISSWLSCSILVWRCSWAVARVRMAIRSNEAVKAMRWLGFSHIVVRLLDFPCLRS